MACTRRKAEISRPSTSGTAKRRPKKAVPEVVAALHNPILRDKVARAAVLCAPIQQGNLERPVLLHPSSPA
jgi:hypothetical protein